MAGFSVLLVISCAKTHPIEPLELKEWGNSTLTEKECTFDAKTGPSVLRGIKNKNSCLPFFGDLFQHEGSFFFRFFFRKCAALTCGRLLAMDGEKNGHSVAILVFFFSLNTVHPTCLRSRSRKKRFLKKKKVGGHFVFSQNRLHPPC